MTAVEDGQNFCVQFPLGQRENWGNDRQSSFATWSERDGSREREKEKSSTGHEDTVANEERTLLFFFHPRASNNSSILKAQADRSLSLSPLPLMPPAGKPTEGSVDKLFTTKWHNLVFEASQQRWQRSLWATSNLNDAFHRDTASPFVRGAREEGKKREGNEATRGRGGRERKTETGLTLTTEMLRALRKLGLVRQTHCILLHLLLFRKKIWQGDLELFDWTCQFPIFWRCFSSEERERELSIIFTSRVFCLHAPSWPCQRLGSLLLPLKKSSSFSCAFYLVCKHFRFFPIFTHKFFVKLLLKTAHPIWKKF